LKGTDTARRPDNFPATQRLGHDERRWAVRFVVFHAQTMTHLMGHNERRVEVQGLGKQARIERFAHAIQTRYTTDGLVVAASHKVATEN